MAEILLPGDRYDTPQGSRVLLSYIMPYWYFVLNSLRIIRRDSLLAEAGTYTGELWSQSSLEAMRLVEALGGVVHVEGMNVMDTVQGPCIFACNHMSTLETCVLPCLIQRRKDVTFVAKRNLMKHKWFWLVLNARDPIIVDRENPRADLVAMLEQGVERLNKGLSIIVFPQSTRALEFNPAQFNSIAVKLAKRASVPVIPVALRTDAWSTGGRLIKEFSAINPDIPIQFSFGKPIYVEGNGKAEHAAVVDFISERLRFWGAPVVVR